MSGKPPVSRADAKLIAEAASDCAKVASYWKERALSSEAGISEFATAEAPSSPMTQPDLARLEGLLARANSRKARSQTYDEWNDDRARARYEIVDATPTLLARVRELEEALEPFARMERSIMIDLQTAHNRGPGANSEMRSDDRDMRADLRHAFGLARATLALNKENPDAG